MKRYLLLFLWIGILISPAVCQPVKVPAKMEFAGINLTITYKAREDIQKSVNALMANPKYYNILTQRARTYFPIIERIFEEEKLPGDFKYLVLQESALIADAVSTSNAVGFWQFKDFTAVEVGLRVDHKVDERKNIVSSTRGAARYMHKNNKYFDNWLHALQAYQMGAGGALKVLKLMKGARSMTVDKNTYWYVKKFLAHKVAFETVTNEPAALIVRAYYGSGKTLKQIAREVGAEESELEQYNKWLKKGIPVPADKPYAVIIPATDNLAFGKIPDAPKTIPRKNEVEYEFDTSEKFPEIEDNTQAMAGIPTRINGLRGLIAQRGDRLADLAKRAGLTIGKLLKINDLTATTGHIPSPGEVYYTSRKRNKARTHFYVVQYGETLWSVSQKFGIKLKKLKTKNRLPDDEAVKPGRVLWLRYIRPARVAPAYREVEKPKKTPQTKDNIIPENNAPDNNESANRTSNVPQKNTATADHESEDDRAPNGDAGGETEPIKTAPSNSAGEALPVSEEPPKEEPVRQLHEVKPGETYYAISNIYNVAVLDLLQWNALNINDKLSVGQKLIIFTDNENKSIAAPVDTNELETTYHNVESGETLYSISRKYNISVQSLMKWNGLKNTNINPGQKIKILPEEK